MATYQGCISAGQQDRAPEPTLLSGWKDIANYLGKGVRTVQRYERELRLPVRRPAGKTPAAVIAVRSELDEWVSASPLATRQRAQVNPERILNLKGGFFELHRLCAAGRELTAALMAQRTALQFNIERLANALTEPSILKAERHREIAMEQKARATEMLVSARGMKNRAIEMRKPPYRSCVVVNF